LVSGAAGFEAPHSALDFDLESVRVTSDDRGRRRFARGGVRTLHTVVGGLGTSDTVRVNDDTLLTVLNCVLAAPARWSYTDAEPTIMLRASMSCDVAFRLSGVEPMVFNRPELTLVALPAGRTLVAEITSGVRQQGMVAVFRGPSFARMYGLTQDELPPLLADEPPPPLPPPSPPLARAAPEARASARLATTAARRVFCRLFMVIS
jgi:hypothetical protein